jgi:hypothetical protein
LKCLCEGKNSRLPAEQSAGKRYLPRRGVIAQQDEDGDVGKPSMSPSFFDQMLSRTDYQLFLKET